MSLVRCPDCGMVFPYSPEYLHTCAAGAKTFCCWYRMKKGTVNDTVRSLCMLGAVEEDPLLDVKSRAPDGTDVSWARRHEGGLLVWYPPDWWNPHDGHTMHYSKDLQRHEVLYGPEGERLALQHQTTVILSG